MIKKEMILIDEDITSRQEAINRIVDLAVDLDIVANKKEFIEAVYHREDEVPTSIGYNVAIPHGKSDAVKEVFVAYLRTANEFIWDERNMEKVNSIFLMGLSKTGGERDHLIFLSQISKNLMNEEFREALQNCKTREEAFELLETINESVKKKGEQK